MSTVMLDDRGAVDDQPRDITSTPTLSDRIFHGAAGSIGFSVLVITGSIGVFLAYQSYPTLKHYGFSFFTTSEWSPERNIVGISSVLLGTLTIALVALFFAAPLALCTALYISE